MGLSGRQAHRIWCHPAPRQQQCPSSDGGARLSSTGSQRRAQSQRVSPEHKRLTYALLLSLLIHMLLLSLASGGQGLWFPGLVFPWQDRRIEVPDLRVVVVPAQVTAAESAVAPVAEPLQQAWVEQPVASGTALTPSVSRPPAPRWRAAAIVPEANPRAEANPGTDAATGADPAKVPLSADRPGETASPPIPAPAVIALERTDEATWVVPVTPAMPTPVIAAAPSASSPETAMPSLRDAGDAERARIDQEASERAVELAKLDASKEEGQRQAEQREAARQDAARQEAARAENARLEAERQEAAARSRPRGSRSRGSRPHRSRPHGSRPQRSKPHGSRPQRSKPHGSRPHGSKPHGSRPHGSRPHGSRPHGSRPHGSRPHGSRPHGSRPLGSRPHGSRPHGSRPHGSKLRKRRPQDGKRCFGR